MSVTVDYVPFATSDAANVDSQANFIGSGYQENGFSAGLASSARFNKVWRQCSMPGSALANFIANTLNVDVSDDGNLENLITLLTEAIATAAANAQQRLVSVAYSATPIFDASQGNSFEMVLTGNVTSASFINVQSGMTLRVCLKQDGTGGRSFVASNFPVANIDGTAGATNILKLFVDSGSNIYADSPLVVS